MSIKKNLFRNWEFYLVVALPIIMMPLLFIPDDEFIQGDDAKCIKGRPSTKYKCAYVLVLMAVFWMVEAIPLAITSLMPVILLPLLGVQDTASVSKNYMKETNMMFIASLIIALAVEQCNLHRRLALKVMTTVGSSPIRLMFGIMLTTMFLSMWLSNTATTAMVVPIAIAVLDELETKVDDRRRKKSLQEMQNCVTAGNGVNHAVIQPNHLVKKDSIHINELHTDELMEQAMKRTDLKKMLLFSIALASNVGGTAVITGTGSNLAFQEAMKLVDIGQNGKFTDISFATWMVYNVPPMLINIVIIWVYLVVVYFGIPDSMRFWSKESIKPKQSEEEKNVQLKIEKMLKEKYEALGRMTFHETAVFILFTLVIFLWMFRDPKFMKGWGDMIVGAKVGDSTAGMFIVFLLFVIPRDLNAFFGRDGNKKKVPALLEWKFVQSNFAWGIMLLLGGGFALSDAALHSGLSQWFGLRLNALENLPKEVILILVMILTASLTEVSSNVACATVILPILNSLSQGLNLHPLYLAIPATVTCSYAFLLPVATPPNAIIFAAGNGDISIMDMVKIGALPNVICMVVIFVFHVSYGNLIFDFDNFEYAGSFVTNHTLAMH